MWHPSAKFAILGVQDGFNLLTQELTQAAETNNANFRVRELTNIQNNSVGATGYWAWDGGWNTSTNNAISNAGKLTKS